MNLPKTVNDPEMGARLEMAVVRSYPSKAAFARQVQVAPQTLAKWFNGRFPAGYELMKIAKVLPGQIEWILTGTEMTEMQEWQSLLAPLTAEEHRHLKFYAALVGMNNPSLKAVAYEAMHSIESLVRRVIDLEEGRAAPPVSE